MKIRNPDTATTVAVGLAERYDPGTVAPHAHKRAQLMYAVDGAMTVLTDAGAWVLPPHRALWIPGGLYHGLKLATAIELRTIYLATPLRGTPNWDTCRVLAVTPLLRELILAAAEFRWDYPKAGPEQRLISVLLDRIAVIEQQPVHLPRPKTAEALRFADLMAADPTERRPLFEIARQIGLSVRTLERQYKLDTGMSVGAWVQQLRLVLALEMLARGLPVGDVAFQVGYENPSSFIAVFRRAFGMTPTAYFARQRKSRLN